MSCWELFNLRVGPEVADGPEVPVGLEVADGPEVACGADAASSDETVFDEKHWINVFYSVCLRQ